MRRESIHDDGCAACESERHWNIGGVIRIGPYHPPLKELVRGVKFGGSERDARVLGELIAARLREAAWFPALDALVPVPMHWLRRLQRPCAHADVLAEAISRAVLKSDGRRIPVLRAARRVRYAPSQLHIAVRAQRFENVVGCFAAANDAPRPHDPHEPTRGRRAANMRRNAISWLTNWWGGSVTGKTICIVDNMLVTGATVHEVSKALRAAGARKIYLAVAARSAATGDTQADPAAFTRDGAPRI